VSAQLLNDGGLTIAWLPPRHSVVPVHHYIIEYRTVGQWVPLVEDVSAERVFYKWKRPSRGATYHFRVISCSELGVHSETSPVYTIKTTGCQLEISLYWEFSWVFVEIPQEWELPR